ncbi:MAG TPA: hypothetical protein VE422_19585 [Terriglobia bacterium]|nr:hypothetical protein [Terriglobia bacterium]
MTRRKRNWLIGIGLFAAVGITALFVAAYVLAQRSEPYIRQQAILYLQERFDSEVELAGLRVSLPKVSPLKLLLQHGHDTTAVVEGEDIAVYHKGLRNVPPMFLMKNFRFEVDLGSLFDVPKRVRRVTLDGMKINIPPKGEGPELSGPDEKKPKGLYDKPEEPGVIIEEVFIMNSVLTILPKNKDKKPLRFDLHRVMLESAGTNVAMKYNAALTNAKPPGEILSEGTFGPWVTDEPGDTPLAGEYDFDNADLGVFKGIAGILESTGRFEGTLSSIAVRGQATVPNFRLKKAGNPVPLSTRFEVLVDGTNGNTILKPVTGTLGKTSFTTSGAVIKRETDAHRSVSLDVTMPKGNLRDLLRLAMKGDPFMEGRVSLKTKIDIPPLTGTVREKLLLDGQFEISEARFLKSRIQDRIDSLSRRGRGQPTNMEIDAVLSGMAGVFKLENEMVTFHSLSFGVPGAGVDLAGTYDLESEALDFHGTLKLQAKVSQTMTGWKRWVLKPVDPFFSKQGAGTLLRIQVVGTAKKPDFGRDRGKKSEEVPASLATTRGEK